MPMLVREALLAEERRVRILRRHDSDVRRHDSDVRRHDSDVRRHDSDVRIHDSDVLLSLFSRCADARVRGAGAGPIIYCLSCRYLFVVQTLVFEGRELDQ